MAKAWRPTRAGTLVIEPRDHAGTTQSGLYLQAGTGSKDLTRKQRLIADVVGSFKSAIVQPGDTVVFMYGTENELTTASGEKITLLSERHAIVVK